MTRKLITSIFLIVLVVATSLIYCQTLDDEFHFDDMFFIVDNAQIRDINNFDAIWGSKLLLQPSRFIGFLSFAINYHFHRLDVFGYHLTNLIIHVLSAIFVYWLVSLLLHIHNKEDKNNSLIAIFAALLFAVHPAQTQAVTYISQRFASLATLFYLISLCCYLKGRCFSRTKVIQIVSFAIAAISAVLGMLTKEIVITLPLMILLIEYLFASNKKAGKTFSKWLPVVLVPFFLIIPILFKFGFSSIFFAEYASKSHQGDVFTFVTYGLTQLRVLATFLRLLFVPIGQNLDYDFAMSNSLFEMKALLSLTFLISILVVAFRYLKRQKIISFGIFWFFLVLSINFIPREHAIFEHKLYLASIGIFLAVSTCLLTHMKSTKTAVAILSCFIVIFSALAFNRNKVWHSEITLWEDVLKKSPNKTKPMINLGNAYFKNKDFERALKLYKKAIKTDEKAVEAYNGLGLIYKEMGKYQEALDSYNKVLALKPGKAEVYSNRGVVLKSLGKFDLALEDQNMSLKLNPHAALTYVNRGVIYKTLGKYDLALADYAKALEINPKIASAYANRGVVFKKQGNDQAALAEYEKALTLNPNISQVYYNRSLIYNDLGDKKKALQDILIAQKFGIPVDPKYIEFLNK